MIAILKKDTLCKARPVQVFFMQFTVENYELSVSIEGALIMITSAIFGVLGVLNACERQLLADFDLVIAVYRLAGPPEMVTSCQRKLKEICVNLRLIRTESQSAAVATGL